MILRARSFAVRIARRYRFARRNFAAPETRRLSQRAANSKMELHATLPMIGAEGVTLSQRARKCALF
jgi:hypothetical protein